MRRTDAVPGLLLAAFLVACDESAGISGPELTPGEAQRLIAQRGDDPDFVILDVRTQGEYDAGHIEDAIRIDFYAPDFEDLLDALPRDRTYLVYCRTGNRSSQTAVLMDELGFEDVFHLTDGFTEWVASGRPWTVM